jgi:DNA-binding response OmpR family regulator
VPPRDGSLPSLPILVASADPRTRNRCCTVLEGAGLPAGAVADGLAALRYLSDEPCALMLLDWSLPGVTPGVVAAAVRASFGTSLPIVLLAPAEHGPRLTAELRAAGWVPAPVEPEALLAAVRAVRGAGSC